MTPALAALLAGLLAGFFGAIPPGPINVTVIRKASRREAGEAFRVALGGAFVDALICALVGMGFGWAISWLTANRWVKGGLALFLLAYGLKVLLVDRKKDAEARADKAALHVRHAVPAIPPRGERWGLPLVVGLLQGAANPALIVNWTLVIGFLVGHGILGTSLIPVAIFAAAVGVGVLGWFALLIEMVLRLDGHPAGRWLRHSTTLAGLLLVAFGLAFTVKTALGG